MLEGLLHLFQPRPWHEIAVDALDLALVSYLIYRMLLVMRGTRAMQVIAGLALIVLVYFGSRWAGLITLNTLLSYLLSSLILVVVVVFQSDIRRVLMRVGSRAIFRGGRQRQADVHIDEVVAAATELARHRIGALICFEQEANLDEFATGLGTPVDALLQRDLLVSLFLPEGLNKLHDGAVLIRNWRIAQAGVFFPMPEAKGLDRALGTRHRAAIGVSDETDAVVVVVSEERGSLCICVGGNIIPNLDGNTLRQTLKDLLSNDKNKREKITSLKPKDLAKSIASPEKKAGKRKSTPPIATTNQKGKTDLNTYRNDTLRSFDPKRMLERENSAGSEPEPREGAALSARATAAVPSRTPPEPHKLRPALAEPETRPMQSSLSSEDLSESAQESENG